MRKMIAAAALTGLVGAGAATAQEVNGEPNYGSFSLSAGFNPDPQRIDVRSGGSIDASGIDASCRGFVSARPDIRLNYSAGSLPLIISVASEADTTLVVNGPDGRWYCDDDSGENGLNPSVRFSSPRGGRYEVWVGTYGNTDNLDATISISELESE